MFGESKKGFSVETLNQYIYANKFDKAKKYVLEYFIRLGYPDVGVMMWHPLKNTVMFYSNEEIKKSYLPLIKFKSFNLHQWFFNENTDIYIEDLDHKSPKIYEKDNTKVINIFPGYLHLEKGDYDKTTMEKVKAIWDHIEDVWCSGNQEQFEYVKNWFAHMVSGRKMQTALYLKSGQGTGKSIILEFLEKKVLGPKIAMSTSNPDTIFGAFNESAASKVLIVLEELPSVSVGQWNNYSNQMKQVITGSTFEKREKFKNTVQCNNIISVIIATNNNAVKIDTDDRRYVIVDISNHKVGDRVYFNKLLSYTSDNLVGEAFYWDCKRIAKKNPKYQEQIIPITNSKTDLIIDNMHSIFVYIKERYLRKSKGLELTFAKFMKGYDEYVEQQKLKKISKIQVSKILKENKIEMKNGTNNVKIIDMTYDELWNLYEKKHWIHETDDLENQNVSEWEELKEMYYEDLKERKNFYKRVDDFLNNYEKRKQKKVIIVDSDYESEDEISKVVKLLK